MNVKDRIETARRILNNAVEMNMRQEIIMKLSKIIDRYIIEYYQTRLEQECDKK
ncbi:Spo0E family sporulation regulatory protein-aspartic acid phosphatase [Thermoanaerobacterium sp. RBIITD]|uniref:Spo0E family sporulation regulatory protein-aspartic acid phosphatase n=1 Tax=Thermoanaerobacterium sp. RBIITD TaxID=1550240 RepID=UPI000BB6B615|nr:Spo0E family sporulation regulatory protein-aspartic acid phosphatase [Thermoanaerobacterium sp. RBIITD]SNX53908.1 Spo0E like sporulation regulatory protein [Thermoanaerobacterium sp. RBIITD]